LLRNSFDPALVVASEALRVGTWGKRGGAFNSDSGRNSPLLAAHRPRTQELSAFVLRLP
jgi:hypothetical protein